MCTHGDIRPVKLPISQPSGTGRAARARVESLTAPNPLGSQAQKRRSLVKSPLFWSLTSLTGLVIVFAVMLVAAIPLSSDTLRHRIVLYLADKLDSEVELGDLHLRAFPRLRVEGADLRIRRRGMDDFPPLIAIKSFH